MRILFLKLLILILMMNTGFAQLKQIDISSIDTLFKKPLKILVTAVWCQPCMQKFDSIVLNFKADTFSTNLILFDFGDFDKSKFKGKILNSYDTARMFFISLKYYDFSHLINLNPHGKGLGKFLKDVKNKYYSSISFRNFGFGDIFLVDKNNSLSIMK